MQFEWGLQFDRTTFVRLPADRILRELEFDANLLELELDESSIMSNLHESAGQMQRLKSLGVRIAVDHFGAAGTSLTCLQRLPIHALSALKIDRSFTDGLDGKVSTLPLVEGIIVLAHNLGLDVAATGIERRRQYALLRGIHTGTCKGTCSPVRSRQKR